MADTITDNRSLISNADSVPASAPYWVDINQSIMASGNVDTEIFIEGSASITETAGSTRAGIFWEYATTQDLSSNHIYLWINCGVVGLLSAKASQGMTFRIYTTDPTTNYAEWDIGGNDSWPTTSVQGGWTVFVIDLESTPSRTSGTAPSTSAVLGLGISFITDSMPRMVNNTWLDAMYSLADGTAACIVQGKDGGTTAWTWADLPTELGVASGVAQEGPAGSIILNGPIEFFADDATDHAFASTNELVLWGEHEFMATDFYDITILGASTGSADWSMGSKTGTGAAATGAEGGAIIAASGSVRWDFDADIANIDSCNLYGVTMQHGGDFQLDTANNEVISSLFIDTTTVEATNSNAFLKNSYIDSNTAVDSGALVWNENVDVDGILDGSSFEKGTNAHHAIAFGTAVTTDLTLRDCAFNGFGSTDDANDSTVQFLATSGSLILSLVNCTVDGSAATTSNFSVDDAAGVSVTVSIDPVTTLLNLKDPDGNNESGVQVWLRAKDATDELPFEQAITSITQAAGSPWTRTVTFTAAHGLKTGDYLSLSGITNATEDNSGAFQVTVTSTTVCTYTSADTGETTFTGTIIGTGGVLYGATNASGNISSSRTWSGDQLVFGYARKSTSSPRFKSITLDDTILAASGLTINRRLVLDE
jgi:hypothetical protein